MYSSPRIQDSFVSSNVIDYSEFSKAQIELGNTGELMTQQREVSRFSKSVFSF